MDDEEGQNSLKSQQNEECASKLRPVQLPSPSARIGSKNPDQSQTTQNRLADMVIGLFLDNPGRYQKDKFLVQYSLWLCRRYTFSTIFALGANALLSCLPQGAVLQYSLTYLLNLLLVFWPVSCEGYIYPGYPRQCSHVHLQDLFSPVCIPDTAPVTGAGQWIGCKPNKHQRLQKARPTCPFGRKHSIPFRKMP